MPSTSSDFSFAEIVQKFTKIFGHRDSLFYRRHKCFQIQKTDEISNLAYTGLVNKACEDFELRKLTSEQFKCLIYISGMKSKSDTDVRTKLTTPSMIKSLLNALLMNTIASLKGILQ